MNCRTCMGGLVMSSISYSSFVACSVTVRTKPTMVTYKTSAFNPCSTLTIRQHTERLLTPSTAHQTPPLFLSANLLVQQHSSRHCSILLVISHWSCRMFFRCDGSPCPQSTLICLKTHWPDGEECCQRRKRRPFVQPCRSEPQCRATGVGRVSSTTKHLSKLSTLSTSLPLTAVLRGENLFLLNVFFTPSSFLSMRRITWRYQLTPPFNERSHFFQEQ